MATKQDDRDDERLLAALSVMQEAGSFLDGLGSDEAAEHATMLDQARDGIEAAMEAKRRATPRAALAVVRMGSAWYGLRHVVEFQGSVWMIRWAETESYSNKREAFREARKHGRVLPDVYVSPAGRHEANLLVAEGR